jgi:hypothetical protein
MDQHYSKTQLDIELSSLHKKLQGSWSAWTASSSTSKKVFIDEFIRSYDKYDRKVKIRILISLLGLDQNKKTECAQSILKLIEVCCRDKSDQVIFHLLSLFISFFIFF